MKKVLIVVSGGVAEIVYVDNDVDVIVFDEDNDGDVNSLPEWAQKVISN